MAILNGVVGVSEPLGQRFPPRLVSDVRLPVRRVSRRSGHDYLDGALAVVFVMPFGTQAD